MDIERSARQVREDGYTVVPDFLGEERLERLKRGLDPVFEEIGSRLTDDYGQQTIHTHNLLAKTRAVDELLMDDGLLGLVEAVLGPDYQVSGRPPRCGRGRGTVASGCTRTTATTRLRARTSP